MDRLTRIEEALAHQGAQIEELSETLRRQAAEIDRLRARVRLLTERAAEADANAPGSHLFSDQKPPHY